MSKTIEGAHCLHPLGRTSIPFVIKVLGFLRGFFKIPLSGCGQSPRPSPTTLGLLFSFFYIGNDFKLAAVFAGGEAFFAFKDFAEVVGGGETALRGDFEDRVFFEAHHFACGFDANHVEVGNKGHAHMFREDVAEVIFCDTNGVGDFLNGERGMEIIVDIFHDGIHP